MLWTLVAVVVAFQVVLPLILLRNRDRLVYFPAQRPTAAQGLAEIDGVEATLVEVRRPDGRGLSGYDVRPPGVPDAPVLVVYHGNAGNAALRAPWLAEFAQATGLRVVLASYSGYGGNAGRPNEADLYADALAFYDHVVASGVEPRQVVLYGESIGTAAALHVARHRTVSGVIAQSPFASLASMARRAYPWLPLASLLARGRYANDALAAGLEVPLRVVHGTADRIVPFAEGQRLHAAAPGSTLQAIEGAGHNDLFEVGGQAYAEEVGRVVRAWTGGGG